MLASVAPFLALAWVDFAPAALLDDPVPASTVFLAIFVLAAMDAPQSRAAALAAAVWAVHGLALRIRAPHPLRLHQSCAGRARCGQDVRPLARASGPSGPSGPLRLPNVGHHLGTK